MPAEYSDIRTFASGATRDSDDGKLDYEGFISPLALQMFAVYMHKHRLQSDGKLRDSDNWQKGIPRAQYMKSLVRHVMDLWRAWRTDGKDMNELVDLLCAIIFNVQGLLYEINIDRSVGE